MPEFQRTVRARFDQLRAEVLAQDAALWVQVDAAGTIDGIHTGILQLAMQRIGAAAGAPLRALWGGEEL